MRSLIHRYLIGIIRTALIQSPDDVAELKDTLRKSENISKSIEYQCCDLNGMIFLIPCGCQESLDGGNRSNFIRNHRINIEILKIFCLAIKTL